MSKAILIIDMPSSCDDCICRYISNTGKTICRAKIEELKPKRDKRPDWCPLKPMPSKKNEDKAYTMTQLYRTQGYNVCIDELLKGEEG